MKKTINEIYELICEKIKNAEIHRERIYKQRIYLQGKKSIMSYEYEAVVKQESELKGEIEAYRDILCLIESSGVLDDK